MGVCGAFLTGDLFNLYVWFEVMLMASFVLLALGGERRQSPGFGIRGIIEGFYGQPWEDQARLDMIDFASRILA